MQNFGNRRSVQKCAQNAGSNVLKRGGGVGGVRPPFRAQINRNIIGIYRIYPSEVVIPCFYTLVVEDLDKTMEMLSATLSKMPVGRVMTFETQVKNCQVQRLIK